MKSKLFLIMRLVLFIALVLVGLSKAKASEVKTMFLNEQTVGRVAVSPKGVVINFPTKPSKVVLGNSKSFGIEYVEDDLAISPLRSDARSYLYVYVDHRRFSFELVSSPSGNAIVMVRDAKPKEKSK